MTRRFLFVLFSAAVLFAEPAHAAFRYLGEWKNVDPHTGGIVGFSVEMKGDQLMLSMLGACHPKPCVMASTPLELYASAVDRPTDIRAAGATLKTSFSEMFIVLTPQPDGTLRSEVYERFTDKSHRAPFTFSERFSRQ